MLTNLPFNIQHNNDSSHITVIVSIFIFAKLQIVTINTVTNKPLMSNIIK